MLLLEESSKLGCDFQKSYDGVKGYVITNYYDHVFPFAPSITRPLFGFICDTTQICEKFKNQEGQRHAEFCGKPAHLFFKEQFELRGWIWMNIIVLQK